jgi:hypothetical protein
MSKYRVWNNDHLVTIIIAKSNIQAWNKIMNRKMFSKKEILHVKVQAV